MSEPQPEALEAARRVRLVAMDVDGVLTGGEIIYGPGGEWKIFSVKDGHGFRLAARGGLKTAIVTGRRSDVVLQRARELGVSAVVQGATHKGRVLDAICGRTGVRPAEVSYIGDDLVDLPAMRRVGFPVAVADAAEEVKAAALWVTGRRGGGGAVREVIELILKAQGKWDAIVQRYYEQ